MHVQKVSDLIATPYSRPPFLIDGLALQRATHLITGKPGSGKTMFLLHLMHALDTQTPVLGCRATQGTHKCLFVGADAPQWYYHMQVNLLWNGLLTAASLSSTTSTPTSGQPIVPTSLALFPTAKLTDASFLGLPPEKNASRLVRFLDSIIEDEQIDVVFFDTLRRFHHLNERDDQHAAMFMEWLKYWRDKHQLTIFFAHHERKPSPLAPDTGTDRARGSTEWTAGFDAHLSITKNRKLNRYHIDCAKIRGFPEEDLQDLWVEFKSTSSSIECVLSAEPATGSQSWLPQVWPPAIPQKRSTLISAYAALKNVSKADASKAVDAAITHLKRTGSAWTTQRGLWLRK